MTRLDEIEAKAKAAIDSAVRVVNAMAEKYPLGADFDRYQADIRNMVDLCADDPVSEMASLLREAMGALAAFDDARFDAGSDGSYPLDEDTARAIDLKNKALARFKEFQGETDGLHNKITGGN